MARHATAASMNRTQLRALDKYTAGIYQRQGAYRRSIPYGGDTKYADMGIGMLGTATATGGVAGTIVTFYNMSSAFGPGGAGAPAATLLGIPQGTTKNTRIGNKIFVKRIRAHLSIILPTVTSGEILRVILYKDKQANGAAATVTNIMENAAVQNWESFQAMDYVDRITIIKDRIINLNPTIGVSSTSNTPMTLYMKFTHKANCEVHYSSTTGALTEVQSDNYGIMLVGLNGTATVAGTLRVTFIDK